MLSDREIERRVPVWHVLSELFVARKLDDNAYRYIADTLRKSRYSKEGLYSILRDEVTPVFHPNLWVPVCEIDGWPPEQVRSMVLAHLDKEASWLRSFLPMKWLRERQTSHVKERWDTVQKFLAAASPGEHAPSA